MPASLFSIPISRRTVLKNGLQLSALAGTVGLPFKSFSQIPNLTSELSDDTTQIRYSACLVNCGSRCPIKVHVKNKKIIKISSEDGIDESLTGQHQIRPCLRGRSSRWRVYHPDRLKYPMLRVGKRGEGKFKRITWDEATTIVAEKLKQTIEKYGNEAVYYQYGSGTTGANLQGRNAGKRLLNLAGGFLEMYGSYSTAQITFAIPFILGQNTNGSLLGQVKYSDLVVMFGHNLAITRMSGGGQLYEFNQALAQSKAKVITIDPRYTESTTAFDAQWIPIKPGTDGALVAALIYTMLQENCLDEEMINRYCVGWDSSTLPESAAPHSDYKSYLLGLGEDNTEKTPQWASQLTGIPVKNIIQLAREISRAKSAFITQGWGIQRAHQGEHAALSIIMLSIVTGHFGRPGTNVGTWGASIPYAVPGLSIPNPVKVAIPTFMWTDAISRGTEMTATRDGVRGRERLQTGIKFLWHYASNITYNQHSDLNKTHDVLVDESLCEFIVIWDNHMTASAKYADLLLPDVSALESDDLINSSYASGAYQFITRLQKAIDPLWECRLSYDVFAEIATKMGIGEKFTEGRTYQQWLEYSYQRLRDKEPHLPPFEQTDGMGVVSRKFTHADEKTGIELRTFRDDPQANPLKTPSGKVEIYSERLAKIGQTWELRPGDAIPPIPRYCPTIEGVESPLREKYPLQMIGFHTKGHCHSTYPNIEQLIEVAPDRVWINPIDAEKYGINPNTLVEIFNDRGRIHMRAKVTPNIIPGVIAVPQGAWAKTDSHGVDIGGCINRLTTQHPAPLSKGNPQHTNLVDIKRV